MLSCLGFDADKLSVVVNSAQIQELPMTRFDADKLSVVAIYIETGVFKDRSVPQVNSSAGLSFGLIFFTFDN